MDKWVVRDYQRVGASFIQFPFTRIESKAKMHWLKAVLDIGIEAQRGLEVLGV